MKTPLGLVVLALFVLASTIEAAPQVPKVAENAACAIQCQHVEFEDPNCIYRCVSGSCRVKIFGAEPLEPGEIDSKRDRLFNVCTHSEERDRKSAERAAERRTKL